MKDKKVIIEELNRIKNLMGYRFKTLNENKLNYNDFSGDVDDLTSEEREVLEQLLNEKGGEFDLEELIDDLNGLKTYKNINLYRIIWIKNKEDIDVKNLGLHYVSNLDSYGDWIEDLYPFHFREDEPDIKDDLWLITISVPTQDLDYKDYKATLVKNIKFPYEYEIQLKTDNNIKVISISKYY
jgi:hypothetical protein